MHSTWIMLSNITILAKLPQFPQAALYRQALRESKGRQLLCFLTAALVQVSVATSELDTIRGPDPGSGRRTTLPWNSVESSLQPAFKPLISCVEQQQLLMAELYTDLNRLIPIHTLELEICAEGLLILICWDDG